MMQLNDIYKCSVCGNLVEVVHAGAGELVCCGKPMKHLVPGETDGAAEKHVPVIEKIDGKFQVTVGAVLHPSLPEHYIEFIELICNTCGQVQRRYLKPGDKPQATFTSCSEDVTAREYCNLHGLWQSKK